MFIEFHCPACNQRLRVPESAAGKQAKCPGCEQINNIPMASTIASEPAAAPPPPVGAENPFGAGPSAGYTPDAENPFASPATSASATAGVDASFGPGVAPWPNPKLEATYAVSTAWSLFKDNLGPILGGFMLMFAVSVVINIAQQFLQGMLIGVANQGGDFPGARGAGGAGAGMSAVALTVVMASSLIGQAVQIFLSIGFIRIMLEVARGRNPEIGMLFSGGPWFLRAVGSGLIFGILLVLGFLALIVPGIYFAMRYWPYLHFIIDQDCGVGNAFSRAGEATKNNYGEAFILALIGIGLVIAGMLALCVGYFVAVPVVTLAWTIAYLMITAQPFKQQQRIV